MREAHLDRRAQCERLPNELAHDCADGSRERYLELLPGTGLRKRQRWYTVSTGMLEQGAVPIDEQHQIGKSLRQAGMRRFAHESPYQSNAGLGSCVPASAQVASVSARGAFS
jgi:hypothetical protein